MQTNGTKEINDACVTKKPVKQVYNHTKLSTDSNHSKSDARHKQQNPTDRRTHRKDTNLMRATVNSINQLGCFVVYVDRCIVQQDGRYFRSKALCVQSMD